MPDTALMHFCLYESYCTTFIISKHMCLNKIFHQGLRSMSSCLKYSRD